MSGSAAEQDETGKGEEIPLEVRARAMGWRPKEEYKGSADGWRDAAEFVRRGEEDLPVLRERARTNEKRLLAVQSQLTEATSVISDLTDRVRNSDERAYKRARADLIKERDKAVELGDTADFRRVEAEIADLETTKPKPERRAVAQPPEGSPREEVHPEALAWANANPWYHTDEQMRNAALSLHTQLLAAEPTLSVKDNLARVQAGVAAMFPGRGVGVVRSLARRPEEEEEENPRRREPAAVGAGREGRGRERNPRSFDTMSKDSKDAFARYAKAMEGKGKPLTKEDWAKDYWDQFEEV